MLDGGAERTISGSPFVVILGDPLPHITAALLLIQHWTNRQTDGPTLMFCYHKAALLAEGALTVKVAAL